VEEVAIVGVAVETEIIATTVVTIEATETAGIIVTETTEIDEADVMILVIEFDDVMIETEVLHVEAEVNVIEETPETVEHAM